MGRTAASIAAGIGVGILPTDRLVQVWFSGVHANVGGGYPDDLLANVSLSWMMAEARDGGLKFKTFEPDAEERVKAAQDKDGRLYDSRAGLGGYYRYGPRRIEGFYPAPVLNTPLVKIHESVFARIQVGAHLYAPITLPSAYEVVRSFDRSIVRLPAVQTPGQLATVASAAARHDAQQSVWNIVWKRRAIYFLTVFASGYTALYPFVRESYDFQEMATRLRFVSDTIRLVGIVLPNGFGRWLDGYARDPGWFLVWAATITFLIWYGTTLKSQANSRMRRIWDQYLPGLTPASIPPTSRKKWTTAWWLFMAVLVYAASYPCLQQYAALRFLTLGEPSSSLLDTYTQQPSRLVLWTFLVVHFLPERGIEWLRTRSLYQSSLKALKLRFAPAAFAVAVLYAGFAIANHILFNVRDSSGAFCEDFKFDGKPLDIRNHGFVADKGKLRKSIDVYDSALTDRNSLCFPIGVFAQRGQKYAISIRRTPPKEAWTFWNEPAFFGGQPVSHLEWWKQPILLMLYPFRRTLDRPWSSFIVRYGPTGNEESFLDREPPVLDDDLDSPLGFNEVGVVDDPGILGELWTAKRDGELYVYLNKPVLGFWGVEAAISKYLIPNTGRARITIERK